jgi:hypothetical protein
MVNITISVFGAQVAICRAASSPFITGICKSSSTTSGCNSFTFSTATLPFSASPHTSQSLFCSMVERKRRRIRALSSAIIIVCDKISLKLPNAGCWPSQVLQGDGRRQGRAPSPYALGEGSKYPGYCTLPHFCEFGSVPGVRNNM